MSSLEEDPITFDGHDDSAITHLDDLHLPTAGDAFPGLLDDEDDDLFPDDAA